MSIFSAPSLDLERFLRKQRAALAQLGDPQKAAKHLDHFHDLQLRLIEDPTGEREPTWGCSAEGLKRPKHVYKRVKFRASFKDFKGVCGRFKDHNERELAEIVREDGLLASPVEERGDESGDYESYTIFVFGEPDGERHLIETIETSCQLEIKHFQDAKNKVIFELVGVLLIDIIEEKYKLLLLEIRAIDDPLDLIDADPLEIEEAKKIIQSHEGGSLLKPITDNACRYLGIDDSEPQFREALEFGVLQAASHGVVDGANAHLHNLLVGPPGCGKNVQGRLRYGLHPVSVEIDITSITPDGVFGNAGCSNSKRVIRPGQFPQANQGALAVEDFVMASNLHRRRIVNPLTGLMETGRLTASNASRSSYTVEASIHVDTNRASDLGQKPKISRTTTPLDFVLADLKMPLNLLTRFDYIIEFRKDIERQKALALKLAARPIDPEKTKDGSKGMRQLKIVIAFLRHKYPEIRMNADVGAYLAEKFELATSIPDFLLREFTAFGDFLSRAQKSFRKMAVAHARLCDRGEVLYEDVDAVFHFVLRKIETVLGWTLGGSGGELTQRARKIARQTVIRLKFRGRDVFIQDLRREFPDVHQKTLERDLEDIGGRRNGNGQWRIPTDDTVAVCESDPDASFAVVSQAEQVGQDPDKTTDNLSDN